MNLSPSSAEATKPASVEFLRFLAAGGVAAAVNIASRWAFDHVMGYSAAIVLGYLCGMVTAFVLMKFLVFGASRLSTGGEAVRFTIVNLAAVVQVWGISVLLAEWAFPALGWLQHRYDIAGDHRLHHDPVAQLLEQGEDPVLHLVGHQRLEAVAADVDHNLAVVRRLGDDPHQGVQGL